MVPDGDTLPESKKTPDRKSRERHPRPGNTRARFYGALALFIVVASACMFGIPFLRERLMQRTEALYTAIRGARGPVLANIDDSQLPYPEEFQREEYVFPDAGQTLPQDWIFTVPANEDGSSDTNDYALISPKTVETDANSPVKFVPEKASVNGDSEGTEAKSGLQYTNGQAESDAYALLLETYSTVEAMVQGSDPALQFRSWDGAEVEEGIYWIRLVFERGDNPETYIWQVTADSREVVPLSFNARSIQ